MSIDYYTCGICSENFSECSPHGICANCEDHLCDSCKQEQIEKYGVPLKDSPKYQNFGDNNPLECDSCTKTIIRDKDVLNYLLGATGKTIDEIKKEMKFGATYEKTFGI